MKFSYLARIIRALEEKYFSWKNMGLIFNSLIIRVVINIFPPSSLTRRLRKIDRGQFGERQR